MNKKNFILSVIFMICATPLFAAAPSAPQAINYQGKLTDANGQPLETKAYKLTFKIYDQAQNGILTWGPQIFDGTTAVGHGDKVQVVLGYFNVILGPKDINNNGIAKAFVSDNAYLEIAVEDGSSISPRQQILSAPYAISALNAQNGVPIGTILPWIPPNPVTTKSAAEAQLPLGFKICDGSYTTDDTSTTFDERKIPNLLDQRFLMGNSYDNTSSTGGINSIPAEPGHSHSVSCNSWANGSLQIGRGVGAESIVGSTNTTTGHNHGGDNRPLFYSVLFIIRVN